MQQHHLRRLAIISILIGLVAIALALSGAAAQLVAMTATLGRLRPGTIGEALALSALSALLSGLLWWRLIQRLGHRIPFRAALGAYLSAGLAGYAVAIAGSALGSAVSLRRHGIGPGRAVLLTLIANALGFAGILVWAPVGLVLLSRAGMDTALPILGRHGPATIDAALAALVAVMLLALRVLASAAGSGNRAARLLLGCERTTEAVAVPTPRFRHLLSLVPYSALSWITGALALYVVLAAMSHGAHLTLGSVVGAAVVAAALGSLAFFAPEGVGVKDGALVALLTHAAGLPLATGVAAALAVRTLDPLTKLVLLCALAVTADGAPSRRIAGAAAQRLRGSAPAAAERLRARAGRRRAAVVGTFVALVTALSGYGALASADPDGAYARGLPPAAAVSSNHQPAARVAAVVAVPRARSDQLGRPGQRP